MWISERLYVGTGPDPSVHRILHQREVLTVATAAQAHGAIEAGNVAVVPTTDVARDTLILLGSSMSWALKATTPEGRAGDRISFDVIQ